MLAIDGLSFSYPGNDTVFRFDMVVNPGEIVALAGPSGSGKSTLFDLIAGFLVPHGGDIALNGASILGLRPESRPISILFQSENVFEHLSAAANVALGLGGHARPGAGEVTKALAAIGLSGLEKRRAAQLSGGQKQRVALARTLLRNKPILLLDEPFSGLDEATAAPIRETIAGLVAERGWHAILVSHDAADIEALANRRYKIAEGRTFLD